MKIRAWRAEVVRVVYCPIGDGELEVKGGKGILRGLTESLLIWRDLGCRRDGGSGRTRKKAENNFIKVTPK